MGFHFISELLETEVEILEDNTQEIEELKDKDLFQTAVAISRADQQFEVCMNKINELVKAVNEIRKDLNKWSARIVQSNFYVAEKNANF